MSNPGVLESLLRTAGDALSPLADRLGDNDEAGRTLEELGFQLPPSTLSSVSSPLSAAAAACRQLPDAVQALVNAASGSNQGALIAAAVDLGQLIVQAGAGFAELGTALDSAVQSSALTPQQKQRIRQAIANLPERLLHLAVIVYLEERQPAIKGALAIAGLIDDDLVPKDNADSASSPYRQRALRLDRLGPLLTDPAGHMQDLYGFGTNAFDGPKLFRRVKDMVDRPDGEALLIEAPGQPAVLEAFVFRLAVLPGGGLSIRLRLPAQKDLEISVPISGPWSSTVRSSARFESGIEVHVHPRDGIDIQPPAAAVSLELALGLQAENADGSPMIILGETGGSRIELKRFAVQMPLSLSASTGSPSPQVGIGAALALEDGKIVIDGSQADGFLASLIGGVNVESTFDLGASYDNEDGLRFAGSATIEIAMPAHVSLGPIDISTLYLVGGFDNGEVPIEFSADLDANLGPLVASVTRLGAQARLSFPDGGGNAGVAQMDVGFKAPTGVGLALDAGIVRGGGFLYLDPAKGEYAGALEIALAEIVTVKAVGIITTRMPDGSEGFALLIILSAEFGSGFQLGFGFTLNAVGGLVGLNRTMELDAIGAGIRTGGIESVMFPPNLIENAPRIISDLRQFFPPAPGTFLVGPMVKIGWGVPTLVSLSLGVILEIPPGNIAILGVLKVALPDERAALIIIQVQFIGALEVDKQRLWFFAGLFESRVIFITLEGEMGLLMGWGDNGNFVLSVGGFHPAFQAPALPFPNPRRISITILNYPLAMVRVEGYFAVTSNTVQFGARVEVQFGLSEFGISGHLGFDALFQFSPFYFIISISASLDVKVFGIGLFSVHMRGQLEGPTPWHIEGEGRIKLLFWKIKVPFSHTWGEQADTTLPPILVMPRIAESFNSLDNWRATAPGGGQLLVSLRKIEATEALILHPVGTLTITQRALPLDLDLDKVGNQRPTDAKRITVVVPDGPNLKKRADTKDSFAIAQFKDMTDAEKVSAPAYQKKNAGIELSVGGDNTETHSAVKRIVRFEEIIIDSQFKALIFRFRAIVATLFTFFLGGNAASRSVLSATRARQLTPIDQRVELFDPTYVVASNVDNAPHGQQAVFQSHAQAQDFLRTEVARDPKLAAKLHVVPATEIRNAA